MRPHRWRFSRRSLLFIAFAVHSAVSFSQTANPRLEPVFGDPRTGKRVTVPQASRPQLSDTTRRDSVVHLIVRLRTSPGAKNATSRVAKATQIDREHEEFLSKLGETISNANARSTGATRTVRVVREFKRSFNGFTLKANRSLLESIKRMPHVISVAEDKKVKANDEISNEVVKAPRVWTELSATGVGTRIGIIDTGIDYTHPDLGGGFGPTFKVAGGYDFVNDDTDPMDDFGHGTHVAGIAAANGTIKGIAPDAKLYGIKVLDEYGNGWDSQILAGIEYTMDPDGNPATDDALDVVNMSLGRSPGPDDPMSEAVNNAVLQGVVFVISAGNSYSNFTVGTPGIAREAITVAATDNFDYTAYFSSRGPLPDSFLLKPDIAAPGVQVNATYLNSEYKRLDGTSMSAPHVTGIAALMVGKHPDWTPADIKAAMMSTARMTDFTKFLETGSGVVDAYKAITTDIIMSPGSISYGRLRTDETTFTRHDVVTVTNKAQSAQQIDLALEGLNSEAAIDIQITPSQFILAPGATQEVAVDIEVDVDLLENRNIPEGFYGAIKLTSGSKQLKTILSLFNPAVTKIDFKTSIPGNVFIGGIDTYYWQPFYPAEKQFDVMLPVGKYDILCWFRAQDGNGDSLVVIEDYEATTESKTVVIDSKSATNRIEFKPVDATAAPLPLGTLGATVMLGPTTISFWGGPVGKFYISDSKKHGFHLRLFIIPENPQKMYEVALSSGLDITESKVISNDPNQFRRMTITNPSIPVGQQQDFYFHAAASAFGTYNSMPLKLPNPVNIDLFEDPADRTISYYRFLPPIGVGGFTWETSMLNNSPERGQEFSTYWGIPIRTIDEDPFDFALGRSLVNFTPAMSNYPGRMALMEYGPRGLYNHAFGERTAGTVSWTLKSNDQVLSTGTFFNSTQDDSPYFQYEQEISKGSYKFTTKWDSYYVGGRFSDVTTDLEFDTNDNVFFDYNPPVISEFSMTSEGKVTNAPEAGKGATIKIVLSDYNLQSTTLEMQPFDTDTWIPVSLSTVSSETMTATIPTSILAGLYSLRLKAADKVGNRVTHTLSPAFAVGAQPVVMPFTKISPIHPSYYDINAGVTPEFEWTTFANATYTFQLSKTPAFEQLIADQELTATTLTLPAALEKDATYYWRVRAKVSGMVLPWSRTYVFIASTLQPATLISPAKDARDVPIDPTEFTWTPAERTDWQVLEISNDKDFTDIAFSVGVQWNLNTHSATSLEEGKEYFWRLRTSYFTFYDTYNLVSEVNSFRTFLTVGLEDRPEVLTSFPNPFADKTYVKLFSKGDDVARVSLYDHLGRQVRVSTHSVMKGENVLEIGAEGRGQGDVGLSAGMYVGVIVIGEERWRVKLVKR